MGPRTVDNTDLNRASKFSVNWKNGSGLYSALYITQRFIVLSSSGMVDILGFGKFANGFYLISLFSMDL
jgi:hypothetical protein